MVWSWLWARWMRRRQRARIREVERDIALHRDGL